MKQTTEQNQKIIAWSLLLLFAILLLSIVPFFRLAQYEGYPPGDEIYYHIRMSSYIIDNGLPAYDPGSMVDSVYNFDPLHLVIGIIGSVLGKMRTVLFIPPILGIITIICVYSILQQEFIVRKQALLATIFILISPAFLHVFGEGSSLTWITTIMALGLYCFIQETKLQKASIPLLLLLLFYDPFHSIISIIFILIIGRKKKEKWKVIGISGVLFLGAVIKMAFGNGTIHIQRNSLSSLYFTQSFLADVGAAYGLSLFAIILTIIGIQYLWKEHKVTLNGAIIGIILVSLIVFLNPVYGIYLNIYVCIIAAIGFHKLTKRDWKMVELRNITLLLLLLGVIYSGTSAVTKIAISEPNIEMMEGLAWVEEFSSKEDIVLSGPAYNYIVQEQTQRKTVMSKKNSYSAEAKKAMSDISNIFTSRRIDQTIGLLNKYEIEYIIIFDNQETDQKGKNYQEGLIFLLENGVNFKKHFENNKIIVWQVVRDEK